MVCKLSLFHINFNAKKQAKPIGLKTITYVMIMSPPHTHTCTMFSFNAHGLPAAWRKLACWPLDMR